MTGLLARKAGSAAVDCDDYNAVVDAVVALQAGGGGGSQPGVLYKVDIVFNEPAAPHADLVAAFAVPQGTTISRVSAVSLAGPWADAAILVVGDSAHPDGYLSGLDLLNDITTPFDPTDTATDFTGFQDSLQSAWGRGVYSEVSMGSGANSGKLTYIVGTPGVIYEADDTITATVSGIATGGGGGQTLLRFWLIAPSTAIVAA